MLAGFLFPLSVHPAIYRFRDIRRQIDLFNPHVHHLYTQLFLGDDGQFRGKVRHQLITLTTDDFLNSAHGHLVAQPVVDPLGQQRHGAGFLTIGCGVELRGIRDAELGVGIDNQGFLFLGKKALRLRVHSQYPAVKFTHIVDEGDLAMQTRLDVGVYHLTKLEQHTALGLLDYVQGIAGYKQHQYSYQNKGHITSGHN